MELVTKACNATLSSTGSAYTPAQIRTAYGINDLSLDGTGQTIAIVDAYDDPAIFQAVDTFDNQFGLPPPARRSTSNTARRRRS